MRIDGVIAATCFILLHRACADERGEEGVFEKITSTINDIRFHLPVNSTWCDGPDKDLLSYRSVFDLIPKDKLTNVPVSSWTILCNHFSEDVGFVSRVLDLLKNDPQLVDFLTNITVAEFAGNSCSRNEFSLMQIVAEDLVHASVGEENALRLLYVNRALLLSAPSHFLLNLNDICKALLIYVAAGTNSAGAGAFWMRQSPLTKRTWSTILMQLAPNNRIASLIQQQTDSRFFQVLDTIDMSELQRVLTIHDDKRASDTEFFRSVNWNTVQIRKIVDFHFKHTRNSSMIEFYNNFLSRLLPVQMASWLAATTDATSAILNHLRKVDEIPLPQASQLFECIIARLVEKFSAPSLPYCAWAGKLLHSQTNTLISRLYDDEPSKLNMTLVKCSDSNRYSLLQSHYIFGRNEFQDDEIDRVLNVKGLVAAIPASFYIKLVLSSERRGSLESHFGHILKYFPARANMMAAFAAFRACKIVTVPWKCIKSVLENNDNEILSTVSPSHIRKYREEIWHFLRNKVKVDEEFKRRVARFPSFVLAELLGERHDVITYHQLFDETYPIALLILGFNCEILSRIPSYEFLPILQFYNKQRKLYNKEFPKDLQKCAQRAFLRYLRTKSNISVAPLKADLAQYVDLADIRSIGGYVLATLPATSIAKSKYGGYIVAEIGRLSLPELLLAVPGSHLVSITSQYLKDATRRMDDNGENYVRMEHLTTLGNLTHFLDDEYVRRIDPSALKFLLEAEFIDTRICASSSLRKTWAYKLSEAFGSPATWDENTLLRIGDMLIVLDESSFLLLNTSSCSRAVDLMKSEYTRFVEWTPRSLPFHEVCSAVLLPDERPAYQSSIQRLALFYAESIQLLLRTIVPLAERNITEVVVRMKRAASSNTSSCPSSSTNTNTIPTPTTDGYSNDDDDDDYAAAAAADANVRKTTEHLAPFTSTLATGSSNDTTAEFEPTRGRAVSNENQVVSASSAADVIPATTVRSSAAMSSPSSNIDQSYEATPTIPHSVSPRDKATSSVFASETETETETTTTTAATFSKTTEYRQSHDATFALNAGAQTVAVTLDGWSSPSTRNTEMLRIANDGNDNPKTEGPDSSASTLPTEYVSVATPENMAFTVGTSIAKDEDIADETSATFSYASSVSSSNFASHTSDVAVGGVQTAIATDDRNDAGSQSSRLPSLGDDDLKRYLKFFLAPYGPQVTSTHRAKRQAAAAQSESSQSDGTKSLNVSCDTLRILDSMSDFVLSSPRVNFNESEAFDCIELLAQTNNLTTKRRKAIWSRVSSKLLNENLTFVAGKVLSAVDERNLNEINLNVQSPGALELISALSQVSPADARQSDRRLFRKILKDNDDFAETENALFPVLTRALGRFVCELPDAMFSRLFRWLRKDKFAERTLFDALGDCPAVCLRQIANAAVAEYGDPRKWPPTVFTTLGPVVAAIPNVSSLIYGPSSNVTRYFSASAFACLRSSDDFVNVAAHHNDKRSDHTRYLDGMPLTSAMLLLEKDCVPNYRDCAFTTSLADVILTEDSLSLEPKINSSQSTTSARATNSSSLSFLSLLFLIASRFI